MSDIKPALTPQEWMIVELRNRNKPIGGKVRGYVSEDWSDEIRHAVAAQCLVDKPFGFTRADVEMLRMVNSAPGARSLADRIEALLPPEA